MASLLVTLEIEVDIQYKAAVHMDVTITGAEQSTNSSYLKREGGVLILKLKFIRDIIYAQ
jgi:hypothetical protein